jgi:hypothetical protein
MGLQEGKEHVGAGRRPGPRAERTVAGGAACKYAVGGAVGPGRSKHMCLEGTPYLHRLVDGRLPRRPCWGGAGRRRGRGGRSGHCGRSSRSNLRLTLLDRGGLLRRCRPRSAWRRDHRPPAPARPAWPPPRPTPAAPPRRTPPPRQETKRRLRRLRDGDCQAALAQAADVPHAAERRLGPRPSHRRPGQDTGWDSNTGRRLWWRGGLAAGDGTGKGDGSEPGPRLWLRRRRSCAGCGCGSDDRKTDRAAAGSCDQEAIQGAVGRVVAAPRAGRAAGRRTPARLGEPRTARQPACDGASIVTCSGGAPRCAAPPPVRRAALVGQRLGRLLLLHLDGH